MTAHEAAHALLLEAGRPQAAKILAERMLKRGMVKSGASDPIQSLAQTIEKNIRGGVYNRPSLEFVHTDGRRLIGLAKPRSSGPDHLPPPGDAARPKRPGFIDEDALEFIEIHSRVANKLGLVVFAGLAESTQEAAELVLRRGFDQLKDEIAEGMRQALSSQV